MWYLDRIPKLAHFYWGNDTLSYLRYMAVFSFKKLNPDWKIKLYVPKYRYTGGKTWGTSEHSSPFCGLDYTGKLMALGLEKVEIDFSNFGIDNMIPETFKADFLRWYLLSTSGGLWSDFDIIYFQSLEAFYLNHPLYRALDTSICLQAESGGSYHSIGFLLSSVGNPYYRFISGQTYGMLDLGDYQSIGSRIPNLYFPSAIQIRDRFPGINLENISPDVVYPINYTMVPYIFHTPYMHYLTEQTIGLHWFAGHPESCKFENLLNDDSLVGYNNIISQVIRRVSG